MSGEGGEKECLRRREESKSVRGRGKESKC